MFAKIKAKSRRGQHYHGHAAWCDDYTAVPKPGFYALTADGKTLLPDVPLVCVDDAPGDPTNGACHYEYAGPRDYPQRSGNKNIGRGAVIEMEVHAEGHGGVSA